MLVDLGIPVKIKPLSLLGLFLLTLFSVQSIASDSVLVQIQLTDHSGRPIMDADMSVVINPTKKVLEVRTDNFGFAEVLVPRTGNRSCEFKLDYRGDHYEFNNIYPFPEVYDLNKMYVKLKYEPKFIILYDVHYSFPEIMLEQSSYRELNEVIEMLNLKPKMQLELVGHCFHFNNSDENQKASRRMTLLAKDYFISQGITTNRISTSAMGSTLPIVDEAMENSNEYNTRLEVRVIAD